MSAVMGGGGGGGSGEYSQLLQRRISELEGSRAREVAGSRAMRRLEECELLTADESELCQVFDNVVIDERVPVGDRIQTVRQYFVDEVTTTLELDRVLSFEMAEFNQANAKHSTVVEAIAAKRKEHNAVTQLRDKLQDLCRMIQQQTKDIVANSNEFESEEKRKSSSLDVQFTTSIEHISSQLVTQEESLTAQDAENKELRDKLNQFEEHMLLRSQHYAAQLKAKELELQLEDAKCAQQNHLYQQTANKLESKSAKLTAVQSSNEEMMTQLTMYAEKFEMFEEALTRSTSMFEQFEHKIKDLDEKLEKINEEKRLRNDICRKLDLTLFGIIDSKSKPDKEVEEALSVKESLQNECRRLQQARTEMLQRQKNAKSESPQV